MFIGESEMIRAVMKNKRPKRLKFSILRYNIILKNTDEGKKMKGKYTGISLKGSL